VFVVVEADSEFICDGLAVDCVEQRVHFIGDTSDSIDTAGVRFSC
jgi:hypothetical protein